MLKKRLLFILVFLVLIIGSAIAGGYLQLSQPIDAMKFVIGNSPSSTTLVDSFQHTVKSG